MAVSVTCQVVRKDTVITENVPVVEPAATVILDGTLVTMVLLVFSVILAPPIGAGPLSVTVPVADVPPLTLVGLTLSDESVAVAAGVIVSTAVLLTLL